MTDFTVENNIIIEHIDESMVSFGTIKLMGLRVVEHLDELVVNNFSMISKSAVILGLICQVQLL